MSSTISRGFAGRNSAGRELKMLYAMKSYAWVLESQDFSKSKVRFFTETKKKAVYREIRLIEVGFLSYLV